MFPQINSDDKIDNILRDRDEINKRVYTFPTSQIKHKGQKSSYYDVINSLEFEECNKALIRIVKRMDLGKLEKMINGTQQISKKRVEFYNIMLNERYEKILLDSYRKLGGT